MPKKETPESVAKPADILSKELLTGFIDFHNHKGNVTFNRTSEDSEGKVTISKKEILSLSEDQIIEIKNLIFSFIP